MDKRTQMIYDSYIPTLNPKDFSEKDDYLSLKVAIKARHEYFKALRQLIKR